MSNRETELQSLGAAARAAKDALYAAVLAAIAEGMTEAAAARAAGIDRMTVRRLLGKR